MAILMKEEGLVFKIFLDFFFSYGDILIYKTPNTVSFSSKKFGKLVWYAVVCVALTAARREPRLLDSQPVIYLDSYSQESIGSLV